MNREVIRLWLERETMENARSRLPDDESVEVPSVWVVELYSPSTLLGLLDGIARLRWEHGRTSGDSLMKWINDVRNGRQAGWTTLGQISPPDDAHIMTERTAVLPPGVKAAVGALMSITPSITALAMTFLLDDGTARTLDQPMRAKFDTYFKKDPPFRRRQVLAHVLWNRPIRSRDSLQTPEFQRRDAVRASLRTLEGVCTQWIGANLPGAFSSGICGGRHPTAILLVTEKSKTLTAETHGIVALQGTGLDRAYDCWESNEWPGGRMTLPRSWDEQELRLTFGCRRRDAFPNSPGHPDPAETGRSRSALTTSSKGFSLAGRLLACSTDTINLCQSSGIGQRQMRPIVRWRISKILGR
jgi:hypothetical protein